VPPGLLHALRNAPRHRANVRAAVPADLRLVMDAPEAQSLEPPPQRCGDGAPQACLAHAGGAHQAEDGACVCVCSSVVMVVVGGGEWEREYHM
jgi:hypothetical protein